MSRTQYSTSRRARSLALLAATAFATSAAPLLFAAPANATTGADCSAATIQYRLAGGDWTSTGGFRTWSSGLDKVEVRLAAGQQIGADCKYPVSLAEYTTEGPSWATSGTQTLVDKATVYLGADDVAGQDDTGRTWQQLSVKTPDCYGQIDLYGDDVTYDGGTGEGHGPAPYQPGNVATPQHLIAAWNGGDKKCAAEETPSTPPSTPGVPEEPSTPPASPTPTPPSAGEVTPPAPTTPGSDETPPTTPEVPPLTSTPPATPSPSPSASTPPLAETGASTPVGPIAGGAAAVVAIGAGALYFANRRKKGAAQ
ncbi:LPXTG cell wall anchor domain-containing protein [Streptomyces roseirectus]|uniref:LPXTG cell wall anchor domain-containing protein n=1 Tax=Streptomyces roseirectus TaxID=2768066 RepID=A0A7H0IP95_9ACTN|nr:LAETG motif-containing sortase-dependent surface protein [Streptomyces roseirectus]QNP74611.1 LPXTG cell wall anchor domain-containing protein [Streptomyces roseirectus]